MKTWPILVFSLFLVLGTIGQANVVAAAGDSCVSINGDPARPQGGNCFSEGKGDKAFNINGGGQFVFAGGGPLDEPSRAFARNGSGAWAQRSGSAEATNNSYASAVVYSTARADDSSYASADNNSTAEAMNDSSAIARTNSTAIAKDGGCAYASGSNSVAIAGIGEIVVVIDGSHIVVNQNNVNLYCRVWPPGGSWPFP